MGNRIGALLGLFLLFVSSAAPALTCSAVLARVQLSDDWNRDRAAIEAGFAENGIPEVDSYARLRPMLAYFDVRETPTFLKLPAEERRLAGLAACRELAKLPWPVREATFRAGFSLWLVVDNVVEHPRMGEYAHRRPRGHPRGTTWKVIPGAGGSAEAPGAIVAVRKNRRGVDHGATNLLLHEMGHNFDYAWGALHVPEARSWLGRFRQRRRGGRKLSSTDEWLSLHRRYVWPTPYEQKYPEEAFAEAFARYYDGAETREDFRKRQPDAFDFFEREVARYGGPPPLDAR